MAEALRCPRCDADLGADAVHGLCPSCLLEAGMGDPGAGSGVRDPVDTTPYSVHFVAPAPAELAPHFPQLDILELLGTGGMGAVYKARQVRLDRLVALKVLPPDAGRDPAFAERFTREARALARLDHPHIVGVHDFGETGGFFYFLMDYVDGADLRRMLAAGPLSPALTLQLIPQVCDALQYAHEEGIVHRDIKPENILLDQKGRVKIADFGLAKLLGPTPAQARLTATRQVMGTPHYMAPEQLERPLEVDHRADIYSLGVVFYEMLTGELPLGRFAPPSQKTGGDERLDEVVLRALEKEPARRYQRASELSAAVGSVGGAGATFHLPGQAEPPAVSVVFAVKAYKGWGVAKGFVRVDANGLLVEYVKEFLGVRNTPVREMRLAFADIDAIELKRVWFTPTLILKAHRLSAVLDFPGFGKEGLVRLVVTKEGRAGAEELVAWVQHKLRQPSPAPALAVARTPREAEATQVSVPFQTAAYFRKEDGVSQGWGMAKGLVGIDGEGLYVEFVKNDFTPGRKSRVLVKRLAFGDIESIELKAGWFAQTLILKARRLSAVADFPGFGEPGLVRLTLTKEGRAGAEEFVAWVRQKLRRPSLAPVVAAQRTPCEVEAPGFRPRSFFRSVLNYCFDSMPARAEVSSVPEPNVVGRKEESSLTRLKKARRWGRLRALLFVAFFASLVMFVSFKGSAGPGGETFEMGSPSPWLTVKDERTTQGERVVITSRTSVNYLSPSFLILVGGLFALGAAHAIKKGGLNRTGVQRFS